MERLSLKTLQNPPALLEDFSRDCRLRGMTAESVRRYVSSVRIFLKFLERRGVNLEEVNAHVLRDFLRHVIYDRKAKYKTVENYFSALSAFYDYLAFEGYVSSNIVLPFRKRYLKRYKSDFDAVSYTHLTLPTNREV